MSKRNTALLIAVVMVLLLAGFTRRRNRQPDIAIDLGFDESDLTGLEEELEDLDFDDLEGLETGNMEMVSEDNLTLGFDLDDLEGLEDLLEGLRFEDLEGLSEG